MTPPWLERRLATMSASLPPSIRRWARKRSGELWCREGICHTTLPTVLEILWNDHFKQWQRICGCEMGLLVGVWDSGPSPSWPESQPTCQFPLEPSLDQLTVHEQPKYFLYHLGAFLRVLEPDTQAWGSQKRNFQNVREDQRILELLTKPGGSKRQTPFHIWVGPAVSKSFHIYFLCRQTFQGHQSSTLFYRKGLKLQQSGSDMVLSCATVSCMTSSWSFKHSAYFFIFKPEMRKVSAA